MLKHLAHIACLLLVVSACNRSSPTASPMETVQAASSATLAPSLTGPLAAATVLPINTPLPPLTPPSGFSPHGLFLAFQDVADQPSKITLFDPIQQTSLVISKPAGNVLKWDAGGLSPDGQYLAYYTGHLDTLTDLSAAPAVLQQIELNIMSTVDGRIVFQKSLLNKDYPQVFLQAADGIMANPPADFDFQENSRDSLAASLLASFSAFITTNSWSPAGHVLAFASGSEGASSDVYTYNLDGAALTRITSGPSEVYKIGWSPDGKWILNSGIYFVGEGMCGTWYVSAADGSSSSAFSITGAVDKSLIRGCDFDQWVSDYQALVSESANGRGIYNLEVMDIRQKSIDLIWPHTFHSFAFDPVAQQVYVSTAGEQQQNNSFFQQGAYQVDLATHKTISIAPDLLWLTYIGWGAGQAIAGIPSDSPDICFLPSHSCSGFPDSGQKRSSGLSVSASRKSLVLYSDTG